MHSRARLTYTQVWAALSQPKKAPREAKPLLPQLQDLYALYHALKAAREARGAIDFDTVEMQLEFDVRGKIVRDRAGRAQRRAQADRGMHARGERLHRAVPRRGTSIPRSTACTRARRRRSSPRCATSSRAARCRSRAATIRRRPTTRSCCSRIKDRPDYALLQTVLLRSLQQARYRPDNVGHFGLSYEAYAHFTSPIRRYPDLLVHRAIKAVLAGRVYKPGGASWAELGEHCSFTERRADDATRDVESWLKCYFMQDKVGESFGGTISGVTSFGIFVTLDDLSIDGLVHVTELGRDYFHFDAGRHALIGERSGPRVPARRARARHRRARRPRDDEDRFHAGGDEAAPARPTYSDRSPKRSRQQARVAALNSLRSRPRPCATSIGASVFALIINCVR